MEEDFGIDTRGTPVGTEEDSNVELPKPVPAQGSEKESLTLLTPGMANDAGDLMSAQIIPTNLILVSDSILPRRCFIY